MRNEGVIFWHPHFFFITLQTNNTTYMPKEIKTISICEDANGDNDKPIYEDAECDNVPFFDESDFEHAKKLVEREAKRLTDNFEAAKKDGYTKFIMFLHYPPTSVIEKDSVFTNIAARYNVSQVIYAHCHGKSRFHDSIEGKYRGREYSLVSGDYLNWLPKKIMG